MSLHPVTSALLAHLERCRAQLRDAVDRVPPDQHAVRASDDRWSVLEILDHLKITESRIARLVESRLEPDRAAAPLADRESAPLVAHVHRGSINRADAMTAPPFLQPRSAADTAAAWAALDATRDTLIAAVMARDGFGTSGFVAPHPLLGPLDIYQWIAFVGSHEVRHAAQIVEIASPPGPTG